MNQVAHLSWGYIHPLLWSDDYVLQETLPRYRYTRDFGDTAGPMDSTLLLKISTGGFRR